MQVSENHVSQTPERDYYRRQKKMIGQFDGRLGGMATITTPEGHVFHTDDGATWWLDGTDPGPGRDISELAHWFDCIARSQADPACCLPSQWAAYAEMLREVNTAFGLYKMGNKELYDRLEARDKALDLCREKNAELVARINDLERAQFV